MSPKNVHTYLSRLTALAPIVADFGPIDITIVQDTTAINTLLSRPGIHQLEIIIKRPNPFSISGDNAAVQAALADMRAKQLRQTLDASEGENLRPNSDFKRLARIAASSGEVKATIKAPGDPISRTVSSLQTPAREDVVLIKDESVEHALERGREALIAKHLQQDERPARRT